MSDIIYPTLDFFIYDLRDALNSTEEENNKLRENFRAKLPSDIELIDPDWESEYLELLPNQKYYDFSNENNTLEGYYYPVRLNDTYGLQIDCSINNIIEPQPVASFTILKEEIESKLKGKKSSIGQTLMLSCSRPENSSQSCQEIAESCYKVLLEHGNFHQDLWGKGRLFNGEIFELWQYQPSKDINLHTLIIIYPNLNSMEKASNLYFDWMGLFYYKHKILFAYTQSRLLKKKLVEYYKKIEIDKKEMNDEQTKNIEQKLEEIKTTLEKYTVDLPQLNFQKQILDINLINYENRLPIIKNKLETSDNLDFFDQFTQLSHQKYLIQISKDYENMELGLRLLESNINLLRSQIESEKSKRDRNFQALVTLVGTGTAITSLMDYEGKICKGMKDNVPLLEEWCKIPPIRVIILPVGMILIFGIFGLLFKKLFFR
ncbi:MAG: hypothetical protein AB4062_11200 [Crocosphaera sp.]